MRIEKRGQRTRRCEVKMGDNVRVHIGSPEDMGRALSTHGTALNAARPSAKPM
jgi:hypothetical protein